MIFLVIVLLHCFIMYLCCLLPLRDILSYCYARNIAYLCWKCR